MNRSVAPELSISLLVYMYMYICIYTNVHIHAYECSFHDTSAFHFRFNSSRVEAAF